MTYSYTYDSVGNITAISENGVLRYSYSYDKLGQLTMATHYSDEYYSSGYEDVYEYVYDKSGNILYVGHHYGPSLSSSEYCSYTYGNTTWGDLLTSYGGTAISYDAIGNPLNWHNAASITWSGRQLASLVKGGTTLSFTYNANGIRTAKNYAGVVTNYIIDGTTILAEEKVGAWRYYYYDESGTVAGINFNGAMYLYRKNLQGDVTGIYNANGVLVVEYTYGPYGEVLSVTGSMANTLGRINPFRYRGYYYDTETGFYYLQSRYYDPVVGRFLNADTFVSTGQGIIGNNMFAYCGNNPVNCVDHFGLIAGYIFDSFEGILEYFEGVYEEKGFLSHFLSYFVDEDVGDALSNISQKAFSLAKGFGKAAKSFKIASNFTTGWGIISDIFDNFSNDDLPLDRKISDSVVDVTVDVGGILASVGIGGLLGTAVCPLFGTAVGIVFEVGWNHIADHTHIVDYVKDGVGSVVDGVQFAGKKIGKWCRNTGKWIGRVFG